MNDTTAYIKLQAMLELVRELKEDGGYTPEFLMDEIREKLEVKNILTVVKQIDNAPNHYFVYTLNQGRYTYERTVSKEADAKGRVAELSKRGVTAVYLVNHLIEGAFY